MRKLNLQKLLDMKDISMTEFSDRIGMNKQSLNFILEDMRSTEKYMNLFAEKLDINPDLLNEFIENQTIYNDEKHKIFTVKDMNKLMDDILTDIDLY